MRRILFGATVITAFVLGCVTAQSTVPEATAAPGPSAGECFAANLWYVEGKNLNEGQLPKMVSIPEGFQPVGGTTLGGAPAMVLCRLQ